MPERALVRHAWLLVALAALLVSGVPLLARPPVGAGEWAGALSTVVAAVALAGWRRHPRVVLLVGPGLFLVPLFLGPPPSDFVLPVLTAYAAMAAERFSGRAGWVVGVACAAYLIMLYAVSGEDSPGLLMLTLPGFLAGTALRLRRETAEELVERGRELDAERELFAELSVRNERARIASELHDIIGHALSVMVVQAAAGQRLADRSPASAAESLAVIAESAHQGHADLQRLIDLLAGTEVSSPDLSLVDEIIVRAARSGLRVTCRLEGDRDGVPAPTAHAAFRVVQESLTNALRYAPGAAVRVLIRGEPGGRSLTVRVENDPAPEPERAGATLGGGRGLIGLRERVLGLGGAFAAGPVAGGGWLVEARLAR